jgi:hypothetical protein
VDALLEGAVISYVHLEKPAPARMPARV